MRVGTFNEDEFVERLHAVIKTSGLRGSRSVAAEVSELLKPFQDDPDCPWPRRRDGKPGRLENVDSFKRRRWPELRDAIFQCDGSAEEPDKHQEALSLLAYALTKMGKPTTPSDLFEEKFVGVETVKELRRQLQEMRQRDEPNVLEALIALGREELHDDVLALLSTLDPEDHELRDMSYVLRKAGTLSPEQRANKRQARQIGICGCGTDEDVRAALRHIAGATARLRAEGSYVRLVPIRLHKPDCIVDRLERWHRRDGTPMTTETVWWRLATVGEPIGPFGDDGEPDLVGIVSVGVEERPVWGEHFAERRPWVPIVYDGLPGRQLLEDESKTRLSPLSDALSLYLRAELLEPHPPHSPDRAQAIFRVMRNIARHKPFTEGVPARLQAISRWVANLESQKDLFLKGMVELVWGAVPDGPVRRGLAPFFRAALQDFPSLLQGKGFDLRSPVGQSRERIYVEDFFEAMYKAALAAYPQATLLAVSRPVETYMWSRKMIDANRRFIKSGGTIRRIFLVRDDDLPEAQQHIIDAHVAAGVEVYLQRNTLGARCFLVAKDCSFGWLVVHDAEHVLQTATFLQGKDHLESLIAEWEGLRADGAELVQQAASA